LEKVAGDQEYFNKSAELPQSLLWKVLQTSKVTQNRHVQIDDDNTTILTKITLNWISHICVVPVI
jgi:hypothetical protein